MLYSHPKIKHKKTVEDSKISLGLVKNGEVNTAEHWGILKLIIKDGKIVKSETSNGDTE